MNRLPSELWQQRTPFLLVWHLVYFCSYQKAKGIKLKCTHYRTRLRGKIRTSPSSHEQDTSTVHMPMCRAVRQGLQPGRVAPSGKAPLHRCQQDRLHLSILSTCHCRALTLPKVESEPCTKASGIFSGFPNDSTSRPLTTESCREQKHRTVTESSGFRVALGGDQHKLCFLLTSDYRNLRERQCVKPVPAQLAHTGTLVSTHWHVLIHGLTAYPQPKNSITDETFRGEKLLLLHHGKRKAANCLWCHEMCFPTTHRGRESNFSFKVSGSKL